ncbi:Endo/exonuclease/phosphatase domain-containing protein [Aphis craccivora]|uniref:Endo/exonuclease/phosphatase domain-containing protein n=1 Tax=Aphis craccivora TaxID=307492 RepID=A0A6G0Z0A9_APHCR|nr:Endo/exonuclease/phosphatase domain-containing protein [Aphis craccivora]
MNKNIISSQSNANNTQSSKKKKKSLAIKLMNTADGWTTEQRTKRLHSNSSNSHPESPTSPQNHKSKLFRTTNRYEVLSQNENENKPEDSVDHDMTANDAEHLIKPPPSIYIKFSGPMYRIN